MASQRMYYCSMAATAQTVALDCWELTPADDKPIAISRIMLGQTTDLGDAQEEIIWVLVGRGNTASGSGGTAAANGAPVGATGATSGFTFESRNTTQASSGTFVEIGRWPWNIRQPFDVILTPEQEMECSQASTLLVVRLEAVPADSITMAGGIFVKEGG